MKGEENNKEIEIMDRKAAGPRQKMRVLEEEIGRDEHAQGNNDDDL